MGSALRCRRGVSNYFCLYIECTPGQYDHMKFFWCLGYLMIYINVFLPLNSQQNMTSFIVFNTEAIWVRGHIHNEYITNKEVTLRI